MGCLLLVKLRDNQLTLLPPDSIYLAYAISIQGGAMQRNYTGFGPRSTHTPQTEPIPGKMMVANNAGGFSFTVDDMARFKRFLILGSSGGTYYIGERKLTKENLDVLERLLKAGRSKEVIDTIVEISDAGRAVSNNPALFALARCCASDVSRSAYDVLPKVARTGTHLLHFMAFVKQFRGRGRTHRRAIKNWYNERGAESLAYQLLKYQSRDGWSQRDILRLGRPHPSDESHSALYRWATKGWDAAPDTVPAEESMKLIWAAEKAKRAVDPAEVATLITQYKLPREAVPTTYLNYRVVWEALLADMPMEAMLRNLGTMTKNDVLKPMGSFTHLVVERLCNQDAIHKARLHPIKILAALTAYQSGHGVRGSSSWMPLREIVDALNAAFYLSFANVVPSGKRLLLGLDTSGSMMGQVNGIPGLACHAASAAMALVTAKSEPHYHIIGVDTAIRHLNISPTQHLDDVVRILMAHRGGGTNLALPIEYAMQHSLEVDAFVIYTDSESWAGRLYHPVQALNEYRRRTGIAARMINVQMTATQVTNNDPDDGLAMEVIGFDTTAPSVISAFASGEM